MADPLARLPPEIRHLWWGSYPSLLPPPPRGVLARWRGPDLLGPRFVDGSPVQAADLDEQVLATLALYTRKTAGLNIFEVLSEPFSDFTVLAFSQLLLELV